MAELRLAILGDPVAHSLSPELHRMAMRRLGLKGSYEAIQVPSSDLPAALRRLKARSMTGFNVTLPHKEAILPLLDELDEQAGEVQAVNTVEIRSGLLRGCNTFGWRCSSSSRRKSCGARRACCWAPAALLTRPRLPWRTWASPH